MDEEQIARFTPDMKSMLLSLDAASVVSVDTRPPFDRPMLTTLQHLGYVKTRHVPTRHGESLIQVALTKEGKQVAERIRYQLRASADCRSEQS